jgi:hypothetical protein
MGVLREHGQLGESGFARQEFDVLRPEGEALTAERTLDGDLPQAGRAELHGHRRVAQRLLRRSGQGFGGDEGCKQDAGVEQEAQAL